MNKTMQHQPMSAFLVNHIYPYVPVSEESLLIKLCRFSEEIRFSVALNYHLKRLDFNFMFASLVFQILISKVTRLEQMTRDPDAMRHIDEIKKEIYEACKKMNSAISTEDSRLDIIGKCEGVQKLVSLQDQFIKSYEEEINVKEYYSEFKEDDLITLHTYGPAQYK